MKLWYDSPAAKFTEGLPIGNGRLGAMVMGDGREERLELNEDSLWSGFPRDTTNPMAAKGLAEARRLILGGRYSDAQALVERQMLGPWNESYLPLGDLVVRHQIGSSVTKYRRELSLEEGVVRSSLLLDGHPVGTTVFASAVDQVLVYRLEEDLGQKFELELALSSQLPNYLKLESPQTLWMRGRCPLHVVPSFAELLGEKAPVPIEYGDEEDTRAMRFAAGLVMIGAVSIAQKADGRIAIEGSTSLTLIFAAATSFRDYRTIPGRSGIDPQASCRRVLERAVAKGYDRLLEDHADEHKRLFSRVSLDLGGHERRRLPTDERVARLGRGEADPDLAALYFQFGRYLLLASSRPGSQPANLQGIWSNKLRPAWCGNWTTNINAEMNYWPAEVANLSECHEPLLTMIGELAERGRDAARINYGCSGWVANHSTDLWRAPTATGHSARWAYWPMAGLWLCHHAWEHFLFSQDRDYLETQAYPLLRGAAEFALDWLVEGPGGLLVTAPSTSPENAFLTSGGKACSMSLASTLDIALTRELFENLLAAAELLERRDPLLARARCALERLPPFQTGRHGQLMEWFYDFEEEDPGHRHFSHLYALFPGHQIRQGRRPELLDACRRSLERRIAGGSGPVGWSCAWSICLYARLGDGDKAWQRLQLLLGQSTYPNLLDLHPPLDQGTSEAVFQIDGNFGGCAGIAEMLLQSLDGEITLLPALPRDWPDGQVRGLCARGGFTVDVAWRSNSLQYAIVRSLKATTIRINYRSASVSLAISPGKPLSLERYLFSM
jgi:alpha-L-fucosidase 2